MNNHVDRTNLGTNISTFLWGGEGFVKLNSAFTLNENLSLVDILSSVPRTFGQDNRLYIDLDGLTESPILRISTHFSIPYSEKVDCCVKKRSFHYLMPVIM